jgi:hypothetical protein
MREEWRVLRRILLISLGFFLTALGLLLTVLPIPVPLIGVMPFVAGCIVLSANSRTARRFVQQARHRSARFSKMLEDVARRAPKSWRHILRRTRPDVLARALKMAARNSARV